jgi:hypothetical protein
MAYINQAILNGKREPKKKILMAGYNINKKARLILHADEEDKTFLIAFLNGNTYQRKG